MLVSCSGKQEPLEFIYLCAGFKLVFAAVWEANAYYFVVRAVRLSDADNGMLRTCSAPHGDFSMVSSLLQYSLIAVVMWMLLIVLTGPYVKLWPDLCVNNCSNFLFFCHPLLL